MSEYRDPGYKLWPTFDSYIKKVVRSLNNEYGRIKKKQSNEIQIDTHEAIAMVDQKADYQIDQYPVERQTIQVDDKEYPLDNDTLFFAMQQLPPKLLHILILKYWKGYKEKEIATALHITTRACYDRREKALSILRKIMEENAHGQNAAPE